ncbi:hypothetical protein ABZT17_41660 [Streptomyces sp. NPDC005648]
MIGAPAVFPDRPPDRGWPASRVVCGGVALEHRPLADALVRRSPAD